MLAVVMEATVVVEVHRHKPKLALGPNRWSCFGGLVQTAKKKRWCGLIVIEFSQNTKILPSHVYDFITFFNVSMPMNYELYFKLINQKICFILHFYCIIIFQKLLYYCVCIMPNSFFIFIFLYLKHNDIIKISLIACPMHQCVCLEAFIFNKNITFLSSYSLKIKYVY